jgi:hypothetical protein
MTTIENTNVQTKTQDVDSKPRFTGRYAKQQEDLAKVLETQFNLPQDKVTKILWQAGCDAGAILKKTNSEFSVGKVNSDMHGSLKEVASVKKTQLSQPLQIVHACDWIATAMKNGVCYGGTGWKLSPDLSKYVEHLKVD